MKIESGIYIENIPIALAEASCNDSSLSFNKRMEECLLSVCKKLKAPIPLWMKKNTKELANFRQTEFTEEQFMENIVFDKMLLRILEL